MMKKIHPDFDMLYNIKDKKDLLDCWHDRPTRCTATKQEIIWLCRHHKIDLQGIIHDETMSTSP
jgi:hypothetical protein